MVHPEPSKGRTATLGLLAAFASSACCIAPLLAVLAGTGAWAGWFTWMEPARPWLIGLSAVLITWAWWVHLRPKPTADCCAIPKRSWYQRTGFLASVTLLAVLLNAFPLYSHMLRPAAQSVNIGVQGPVARITIPVKGMTCTGCEHHVAQALSGVPGVQRATASYVEGQAVAWLDPQQVDTTAIRAAIASTGYEPGKIDFAQR